MCEFRSKPVTDKFCFDNTYDQIDKRAMKASQKNESTCPLCEEKALKTTNYDADGCGMPKCNGETIAICGSETCAYVGPECTEDICTYKPPPPVDCTRDDGRPCYVPGAGPLCLLTSDEENLRQKDYLSKFKYLDFSKYTFNKSKYLPSSYLPGDGADFLYGYGLKPTDKELNAGPCGSPTCPMASLDYLLDKLSQPLQPLPTLLSPGSPDYCGGPACPRKSAPKDYTQQNYSDRYTGGPPECPFAKKEQRRESKSPDCPFSKKDSCGAPDCPYRSKKPCGAPDCKYNEEQEEEKEVTCPYLAEETKPKKKKRKPAREYDSMGSCDSDICPFAGMQRADSESSGVSCDNPECPFAKMNDNECYDKNCPYAKELVICQDCGGIIVEDTDMASPGSATTAEEKTSAFKSSFEITEKSKKSSISKSNEKELPPVESEAKGMKPPLQPDTKSTTNKNKKAKPKKKEKEVLYTYPGVKIGHRTCMRKRKNCPANMGWLWNRKPEVGNPELWRGYKPGAVSKTVHKMIREHRRALGIYDPSDIPRKKKSKTSTKQQDKFKRCIEVKKKDGNFFVTVNPLKDPNTLEDFESPYVECTPIQFKIIKPVEEKKPKPEIEDDCYCNDDEESIASSSDLSELDFNFSPPAAILDQRPRKKKVKQSIETQYDTKDCNGIKPALKNGSASGKSSKKGKKKK